MSIVGTRPPTLDEWNKYELHHRARLAIKPGITGMWQVSGRSEITDFEEVVKLDTEYISEWNIDHWMMLLLKDQKKLMENLVCFSDMGLVQRILLLIDTYQDQNLYAYVEPLCSES